VRKVCNRLKLSNDETSCVTWLADSLSLMADIAARPLHVLKPLLADARSFMLLDLAQAVAVAFGRSPAEVNYCREYLSRTPSAVLTPAPLVNGADLNELNVAEGPRYRQLLDQLRQEQLDELLDSREAALLRLRQLIQD
jgi:poly(A) polymerase